jgi:hypothetical protein
VRIYELVYFDENNKMKIIKAEFPDDKKAIKYLKRIRNKKHKYASAKLIVNDKEYKTGIFDKDYKDKVIKYDKKTILKGLPNLLKSQKLTRRCIVCDKRYEKEYKGIKYFDGTMKENNGKD